MAEKNKTARVLDYDQLYPDRFLKSELLASKDVTLKIADVFQEELKGEKGPEWKVVISFDRTAKQWVAPKTCGITLKKMFGRKVKDWIGKRVTLYPTEVEAFGAIVPAIRVRGSPDIEHPMEWTEQLGRAKVTFRVVPTGANAASQRKQPERAATPPKPEQAEIPSHDGQEPPDDAPLGEGGDDLFASQGNGTASQ